MERRWPPPSVPSPCPPPPTFVLPNYCIYRLFVQERALVSSQPRGRYAYTDKSGSVRQPDSPDS